MKRKWTALCLALVAALGLSAAWARPSYGVRLEFLDGQGQVVGGLARSCIGQTYDRWGSVTANQRVVDSWECP
ncbi:hypothetical protein [Roseateles flavus]|uniref:DUF2147 domain-containing protein n=1 Tax=Roseateles flavus TaxID=3149041 RepID=A0ABV0G8X6_9BURK